MQSITTAVNSPKCSPQAVPMLKSIAFRPLGLFVLSFLAALPAFSQDIPCTATTPLAKQHRTNMKHRGSCQEDSDLVHRATLPKTGQYHLRYTVLRTPCASPSLTGR